MKNYKLNKDLIVKEHLEHLCVIMSEERDFNCSIAFTDDLINVLDYLEDTDTLVKRVKQLRKNKKLSKDSVILDECCQSHYCYNEEISDEDHDELVSQ